MEKAKKRKAIEQERAEEAKRQKPLSRKELSARRKDPSLWNYSMLEQYSEQDLHQVQVLRGVLINLINTEVGPEHDVALPLTSFKELIRGCCKNKVSCCFSVTFICLNVLNNS